MRMTVAEAAEIMGVSKDYVRIGLQRGLLPFGTAVKMSNRYTYYISSKQFFKYLGIDDYNEITDFYKYERSINYDGQQISKARANY